MGNVPDICAEKKKEEEKKKGFEFKSFWLLWLENRDICFVFFFFLTFPGAGLRCKKRAWGFLRGSFCKKKKETLQIPLSLAWICIQNWFKVFTLEPAEMQVGDQVWQWRLMWRFSDTRCSHSWCTVSLQELFYGGEGEKCFPVILLLFLFFQNCFYEF